MADGGYGHLRSIDPIFTSLWQCGNQFVLIPFQLLQCMYPHGPACLNLLKFLHQSFLPATVELGSKDNYIDFYFTTLFSSPVC
jgi:hypothetical protein